MKRSFLVFLVIIMGFGISFPQSKKSVKYITGKTPVGFESEINAFLRQDSASFPPLGVYLFTGSSTIRKWDSLQADFKGIKVIQRGFGGSNIEALNYYINSIVLPYKPSNIVVYEGDNDLVEGMSASKFISLCDTFIHKVHKKLPTTIIYFLSVKPSFARIKQLALQDEVNKRLKNLTTKRNRTGFLDIRQLMYDKAGKLRKDFFESDSLHVNRACYLVWAKYINNKILK